MSGPHTTGKRKVFISYARADQAWAAWMEDALRRHGTEISHPDPSAPTSRWADAARSAISAADEVWLIQSAASDESESVALELKAARIAGVPVKSMLVDKDQRLGPDIVGDQFLDARSASLDRLERQLAEAVGASPAVPTLAVGGEIGAIHEAASADHSLAALFPPPPVPSPFIDRPGLSAVLDRDLLEESHPGRAVVLFGLPGSGKTSLAAKFVADHRWHYRDVAWIPGTELNRALPMIELGVQRQQPGKTLIVLDEVDDRVDLQHLLDIGAATTLLVTTRSSAGWDKNTTRRLRQIEVVPEFGPEEAREYLRQSTPALSDDQVQRFVEAAGGNPALLMALASANETLGASGATEMLGALNSLVAARAGRYFLDSDDPRAIAAWERALQQLTNEGTTVELAEFEQGSWRRSWRRRYTPERAQEILDSAERAAEVAALGRPESDLNRNNSEAIARLIEASAAIPNLVVISGSILVIKVTDEAGARIISKTLTATELRSFEQNDRLLSHPSAALDFLAQGDRPPAPLSEGETDEDSARRP